MTSRIEGILVALGTPPESDQPRALIHCTESQIQHVERACMMQPVAIIETQELERLSKIEIAARAMWLAFARRTSKDPQDRDGSEAVELMRTWRALSDLFPNL